MTDEQIIKAVNTLLLFASACIFSFLLNLPYIAEKPEQKRRPEKTEIYAQSEPEKTGPNPAIIGESRLRNQWNGIAVTYKTIELDYLGRYFITAYCPDECGGSWMTSSGETCHWSEDWTEPVTCAIDRSVHTFGEYIQVGDPDDPDRKIYVTEDTGPGVRGLWVDCFVETMDEVRSWPTRWESVYRVTFVTHEIQANEREEKHEWFNYCLHHRSTGDGVPYRLDR